jgi:hypothetical protein
MVRVNRVRLTLCTDVVSFGQFIDNKEGFERSLYPKKETDTRLYVLYPFVAGLVQITIIDVNDNPPTFVDGDTSGRFEFKVKEGVPVGTPVRRFVATDKDSTISRYELEMPPGSPEYFVIDVFTGEYREDHPVFLFPREWIQ